MSTHRNGQRSRAAGIAVLGLCLGASPLLAQQPGYYGYGSPSPQYPQYPQQQNYPAQNYAPSNEAPPPPDYDTENAPYGAQPYEAPGYGPANGLPDNPSNYGNPNLNAPAQALSEGQLEQLVAPVALYPDTLLAEILAGATWPQQIIEAAQWRQAQGNAPPGAIAAGADAQNWDPSVKALTAFPQVLAEMDQNLQWTTELGNAYYNEPDALLSTVQTLRERAQAAGTLENSPQETVSDNDGYIQLAPQNPNVVYVPAYNPWAAYGDPIAPWPGFSLLDAVGNVLGPALQYGLGTVLSAFTPFSWLGWGLNWLAGGLFLHGSGWYPHNAALADWGLPYGGPRWNWRYGGGRGWESRYGHGYAAGYGRGYGRGGYGYARNSGLDQHGFYHGPARPIGNSFGGRTIQGVRGDYAVRGGGAYGRGAYGRGEGFNRSQQAFSRMPSFGGGRTAYGREGYGSGFAARGGSNWGSRTISPGRSPYRGGSVSEFRGGYGGSGMRSSTMARSYGGESLRGGFGSGYRGESSRGFSERGFSSGSHGSRSFSSHFSSHGGGHFGGGSHFSSHGGGHSHGGGGGHSHGGGGHRR